MDKRMCLFLVLFISCVAGIHAKVCKTIEWGLGMGGDDDYWYSRYVKSEYTGCTVINGSLSLSHLTGTGGRHFTRDLSFLSTIEVVTDYVIVVASNPQAFPLTSLREIQGRNTFDGHALIVALTYPYPNTLNTGLEELQMPKLQKISNGSVRFFKNPQLCFVDTIDWTRITSFPIDRGSMPYSSQCAACHTDCTGSDGVRRCWGAGPDMCQAL